MLNTIFLKTFITLSPLSDFPTFDKDNGIQRYFPIIRKTTEQVPHARYTEHDDRLDWASATHLLSLQIMHPRSTSGSNVSFKILRERLDSSYADRFYSPRSFLMV